MDRHHLYFLLFLLCTIQAAIGQQRSSSIKGVVKDASSGQPIPFANVVVWNTTQWTEQDSIWLKDVLAGKDSIQLNPEFQKAIQSGSFLNPEPGKPMGKPQLAAPSDLPITKDFSEYIQQDDTTHRKVALKDLPPSVFWRHNPPYKKILPVYQSILDELKRTPSSGRTSLATFDAGSMTSRKTYVHKRNAKRNGTWQNYGNLPTPDVISKRKKFERQQAEAAKKDSSLMIQPPID